MARAAVSGEHVENAARIDLSHPDYPLRLDPQGSPMIISGFGMKKSGKSHLNGLIYQSWPGDKLCIDVNGNAYVGPDAVRVKPGPDGALPKRFPAPDVPPGERRKPQNLHYIANPSSPTYRDDLDRAVGMALFPQDHRVLLWAGEVGEMTPGSKAAPHLRQVLQQNRHYNVFGLFDGPRPMNVDPLVLAQSDLVAVFRLPNPDDRKRVADSIGFEPKRFEAEYRRCIAGPPHSFLLWDVERNTLWHVPPLPKLLEETSAEEAA
jgi:hypothetical protein